MEAEEYPPNSHRSKQPSDVEKKLERITSGEPIRRKKGIGRRLKDVFFKGDPRVIGDSVVNGILIPAAKDMIIDAVRDGIEKLILGESHRTRRDRPSGAQGYVSYNRMSPRDVRREEPRAISARARSRHEFDEIVLQSRAEAEQVIERMYDIVGQYTTATVADLYELVGIRGTHVDNKWGWSDMSGAGVVRVRDGYLLEMPDVIPLQM